MYCLNLLKKINDVRYTCVRNRKTDTENVQYKYEYVYRYTPIEYNSQHMKWIKKVNQSCPKAIMHFGFRLTLMKAFDLLQMLTLV